MNVSRENLLAQPAVKAMRSRQLILEDQQRELNFRIHNMQDARYIEDIRDTNDGDPNMNVNARLEQLHAFVAQRKQLGSMAARFALSMQPEYFDMTIAEIGATTEAQCPDAIDTLKGEYRTLLDSLKEENIVDDEFARDSKLADRALSLVAQDDPYIILARTRILTAGSTAQKQNFALGKRMVFALPEGAWRATQVRSKNMDEPHIAIVEQMLDQNNAYIIPIRTSYHRLRDLD